MKLALITETFPPEVNGVAMTFGVIAAELAARGHDLTVYHPRRDDLAAWARPSVSYRRIPLPGLPIPRYPMLRLGLPAGRRLRRDWIEERPDLVHVATEGPLGWSAVAAARALGIPVTSSFHTNFHHYTGHYGLPLMRGSMLAWLRYVHNRTLRTFVPTSELVAELQALGFRNLRVLSRGIDTTLFHPNRRSAALRASWQAEPQTPVVLHVGRMAPEKNYRLLFQTYDAMRAANAQLRFVLAGDGPLRTQLERDHPDCLYAGFYSREKIGEYYASADIYIHASLTETFGNVLTEAMASGLAVAGFNYAAARHFVTPGVNGLVAEPQKPKELIRAAVALATDAPLRAKLRRAAPPAVQAHSWSQVMDRFERDLQEAIIAPSAPVTLAA